MYKILLSFVLSMAVCADVMAGTVNFNGQKSNWGAGDVTLSNHACPGDSLSSEDLIGTQAEKCRNGNSDCETSTSNNGTRGVMMILARDISANGVKLCPTVVASSHTKKKPSITVYYNPQGGQNCFWMCKNGQGGADCNTKGTETTYTDSAVRIHDNFANLSIAKGNSNIEDSVAMFEGNYNKKCEKSMYTMEHDLVLGVTDYTSTGHGMWVQPFVVRAHYEKWNKTPAWPLVKPVGTKTLVCNPGYKYDSTGKDCMLTHQGSESTTSTGQSLSWCEGWAGFSDSQHTRITTTVGSTECWQYKCKTAGYGLDASNKCVACPGATPDPQKGISDEGRCITCTDHKVFSSSANSTGYCKTTTGLTKTELQYGKGNSNNSDFDTLTMCWTLTNMDEYKTCVLQGGKMSKSSTGGG